MCLPQGYDADDSDDDWDAHIQWYYGAQAYERRRQLEPGQFDPGVDMTGIVVDTFELGDRIRVDAEAERNRGGGSVPASPDHGDVPPPMSPANGVDQPPTRDPSPVLQPPAPEDDLGAQAGNREAGQPPPPDMPAEESDGSSSDEDIDWGESDDETDISIAALEEAALTPLFAGSEYSCMASTYLILNGGKVHGNSNVYMDELFRLLSTSLLPQPNSLPSSYREASEYLRKLGHSYKSYDVCANNCRLFRGELRRATFCPECRAPRKKRVGKSMVPHKVNRVFPLTPRFKRMYRSPTQAAALTWHALQQHDGEVMTHVSDSAQWQWINDRYSAEFGHEDRNIRMAMIADGFNPSGDKRSTYSIWAVMMINYNLAPWLCTKKYFMMLAVLIPGPKSVTQDRFDEFIGPLLDELLELWTYGIYCFDAARYRESSHFVMKAMVIWTIGDFPAYGVMAGCTTKGFIGCPVCAGGFRSRRSKVLHKNIYCNCARKFLSDDHPMRFDAQSFGSVERGRAPDPPTGTQVLNWGRERERWLVEEGRPGQNDPVRRHGIKRVSGLFRLPYWQVRILLVLVFGVHFIPIYTMFLCPLHPELLNRCSSMTFTVRSFKIYRGFLHLFACTLQLQWMIVLRRSSL